MSYPCHRIQPLLTRREMLARCANGFGTLALLDLFSIGTPFAASPPHRNSATSSRHFPAKAKAVIFLYMDGGPSQVDTFDPKPRLNAEHGRLFSMPAEPTQFNDNGTVLGCPWEFTACGQSGIPISSLFPHIQRHADDLCVVRSMVSEFSEHTSANYFLHTGLGLSGRPSAGAWVSYGLGSENKNLPAFVVLNGGLTPPGGLDNFSNGFLPAAHQGSVFRRGAQPVAHIDPIEASPELQQRKLNFIRALDTLNPPASAAVEAAIQNHELAFRMQTAIPALTDLSREPALLKQLYGFESRYEPTRIFAAECLLARRLVEQGVRFIELTCPQVSGDRWDQHAKLKEGHENNARAVDQPIAALLADLKQRGLLDSTLVLWAGEFGRTPFAQGSDGRDHNPFGFSIWLAGGGAKPGTLYGATDEYGYKVVENPVTLYDLHATLLHLLGIEHTRLTYRFGGRDMRLTDVHGNVIQDILT